MRVIIRKHLPFVLYGVGLFIVSSPLIALLTFGSKLSLPLRAVAVGGGIGIVILGYQLDKYKQETKKSLPLWPRLLLSFATIGLAISIYVAIEFSVFAGIVFFLGAYLFAQTVFKDKP